MPHSGSPPHYPEHVMHAQVATPANAAAVVETITLAFHQDPVWAWAFPDADRRAEHYRAWWAMGVNSSIAQSAVWITDPGAAATAVWVPPGGSELFAEDEARVEPMLREQLSAAHAEEVLELLGRFDAHHPDEPFHYLSLLATHPDHRGHGLGIGLLESRLAELDALGEPSLLESSNPANNSRYARLGYQQIDEFRAPSGGPPVAVMWRAPAI
jgi:GNAT superfamily N-acetyltransferase